MGYHLMCFVVSFFATIAVSPGLDEGACYRQYIPAQSSFLRARCRNPMGGNPLMMGVFIRNVITCCRRQQASGWGSEHNCKPCSSVRGILHPWGNWSNCSRTCGWGEQKRHQVCSNAVCVGVRGRRKTQTRNCLLKASGPVDGNWGGWSQWSGCSASCGEGLQYRTRNCSSPLPSCGGKSCRSYSSQMKRCRIGQCAIDDANYSEDQDYDNQLANKKSLYYGVEGNGAESEIHNFGLADRRSDKEEIKRILNKMDEKEDSETNYFGDINQNEIFDAVDGCGEGDSEIQGMNPNKLTIDWCDALNHVQGEDAVRASGCCDILNKGLTNDTDRARLRECFALHYKYVIGDADDMLEDVVKGRSITRQSTCRYRGKEKLLHTICCAFSECTDWRQPHDSRKRANSALEFRISEPLQNQCTACRNEDLCQSCDGIILSG